MRDVAVTTSIISDNFYIDMPLSEFLAEVTAGLASVPVESRDTVSIRIEQGGGYEGSEIDVTLQYKRPETTEEKQERIDKEEEKRKAGEAREI